MVMEIIAIVLIVSFVVGGKVGEIFLTEGVVLGSPFVACLEYAGIGLKEIELRELTMFNQVIRTMCQDEGTFMSRWRDGVRELDDAVRVLVKEFDTGLLLSMIVLLVLGGCFTEFEVDIAPELNTAGKRFMFRYVELWNTASTIRSKKRLNDTDFLNQGSEEVIDSRQIERILLHGANEVPVERGEIDVAGIVLTRVKSDRDTAILVNGLS